MGVDVVVGYIEPHTRPETLALLDGLEILPVKEIEYKSIKLKEFDLDAALARKPEVILVDEFAHSNVAGLRHTKKMARYRRIAVSRHKCLHYCKCTTFRKSK